MVIELSGVSFVLNHKRHFNDGYVLKPEFLDTWFNYNLITSILGGQKLQNL